MTEVSERREGDEVRDGFEENEKNQENRKWSNGPILSQANEMARNALKTAVPMKIQDVGCQASTMISFKLPSNVSEFKGFPTDEHLDVFRQKPVRITVKVHVPVTEHPKVCFKQ